MENTTITFTDFFGAIISLEDLMVSHIYDAIKGSGRKVGRFEGVEVRDTEYEYPMDVLFIDDEDYVRGAIYNSNGDIDFSSPRCYLVNEFDMNIYDLAMLADNIEEIVADNVDVNLRYNYDVVEDDYSEGADA